MTANTSKRKPWIDGVSARETCLPLEALERLAGGASSDLKTDPHVAGCPHCQAELAMLRSFGASVSAANDGRAVEWVVAHLQRAQDVPFSPVRVPLWRTLLGMPNLVGAATLILVIGLGLSLYVLNQEARPVLHVNPAVIQNMRSGDLRLAGPSGEMHSFPEDFRWYAFPLAKSYAVQLLEVDGTVLWSGQSTDNILIASPELKSRIRIGKQLLWKVTALDGSGKPIAQSSQVSFRVTLVKGR